MLIVDSSTLPHLKYGDVIMIGNRPSTTLADFDFETYSEAGFIWSEAEQKWKAPPGGNETKKGLPTVGAKVYCEHHTFEPLSLKYDLKDGRGPQWWRPGMPAPVDLFQHLALGRLIEAWNVGFEEKVWARCVDLYGWPPLPVEQVRCAMAKSRAYGRPGSLDKAAIVAGTIQKDPAGSALIKKFTVPQKPTKKRPTTRIRPEDEPEEFARFVAYNEQDIVAEFHNSINTPDLSPWELEYWQVDQVINRRGVHVDVPTLRAMAQIIRQAQSRYGDEMRRITGGIEPTEVQQLQGWCRALGVHLPSLDEETVEAALERADLPAAVRRVLEIRSLVGSASVKKVFAMLNSVSASDRLHDLYSFNATRTGRPTGNGAQPTNLPKAGPHVHECACGHFYHHEKTQCPWCLRGASHRKSKKKREWSPEAMYDAIYIIQSGSLDAVEHFFGEAMFTLAGCLRGVFTAAPGRVLMSSDYTAIEAVVLACMANETWRIELFRKKGKLYETSGSLVTGIPLEEILAYKKANDQHHPARQTGKTAELGLGYQGWVGAWRAFEDKDSPKLSDDEIKKIILAWRSKSPAIVEFWGGQSRRVGKSLVWERFGVEGAFIECILNPGKRYVFKRIRFQYVEAIDAVEVTLPSGRILTYHRPRLHASDKYGSEYAISFWGWNTNPKNGPTHQWVNMETWGGRLTENFVQAISNDILRHATIKLERAKYDVVLHTYDEFVSEVPLSFGSVEELESIMADTPEWAVCEDGGRWPIEAAGGWVGTRYRKG